MKKVVGTKINVIKKEESALVVEEIDALSSLMELLLFKLYVIERMD